MCSISTGVLSSSQHSACGCAAPVWGPCESVFANSQMPLLQNTVMHVTFTSLELRLHSPSSSGSLGDSSFLSVTGQGYQQLPPVCSRLGLSCYYPVESSPSVADWESAEGVAEGSTITWLHQFYRGTCLKLTDCLHMLATHRRWIVLKRPLLISLRLANSRLSLDPVLPLA